MRLTEILDYLNNNQTEQADFYSRIDKDDMKEQMKRFKYRRPRKSKEESEELFGEYSNIIKG